MRGRREVGSTRRHEDMKSVVRTIVCACVCACVCVSLRERLRVRPRVCAWTPNSACLIVAWTPNSACPFPVLSPLLLLRRPVGRLLLLGLSVPSRSAGKNLLSPSSEVCFGH